MKMKCPLCQGPCDEDLVRIVSDLQGNAGVYCSTDCLFWELLKTRCKEEVEAQLKKATIAILQQVSYA